VPEIAGDCQEIASSVQADSVDSVQPTIIIWNDKIDQ